MLVAEGGGGSLAAMADDLHKHGAARRACVGMLTGAAVPEPASPAVSGDARALALAILALADAVANAGGEVTGTITQAAGGLGAEIRGVASQAGRR